MLGQKVGDLTNPRLLNPKINVLILMDSTIQAMMIPAT